MIAPTRAFDKHSKTTAPITTFQSIKINAKQCAFGFIIKPKRGSTVLILINCFCVLLLFLCCFPLFKVPERRLTTKLVDFRLMGDDFNDIMDTVTYQQWFSSFLNKVVGSFTDYNGNSVLGTTGVELNSIKLQGITFTQRRRADVPACMDPLSKTVDDDTDAIITRYHQVNTFLGVSCTNENELKFGEILILKNQTLDPKERDSYQAIECPTFKHPFFETNNPFKLQKGLGDKNEQPYDGYVYKIKDMKSAAATAQLFQCNWFDLKTVSSKVEGTLFIPSSNLVGFLTIETDFAVDGSASSRRKLTLIGIDTGNGDDIQCGDSFFCKLLNMLPFIIVVHQLLLVVTQPLVALAQRICKKSSPNNKELDDFELEQKQIKEIESTLLDEIGLKKCAKYYPNFMNVLIFVASCLFLISYLVLQSNRNALRDEMSVWGGKKQELATYQSKHGLNECLVCENDCPNGKYCLESEIQVDAQGYLKPKMKNLLNVAGIFCLNYVVFSYVLVTETLIHMTNNNIWADVPLTMYFSAKHVAHLLLTCLVVIVSYGSYLALQFSTFDKRFTNLGTMLERLYAFFLGDLGVAYGMAENTGGGFYSVVFYTMYILMTIIITITAFNIFLSIVIEGNTSAQEYLQKKKNLLEKSRVEK